MWPDRVWAATPPYFEHQHGIRIAKMLDHIGAQVITHRIGIPVHAGEEILHAIGTDIARGLRQMPAVLALQG